MRGRGEWDGRHQRADGVEAYELASKRLGYPQPLADRRQLDEGTLVSVLDDYNQDRTMLRVLWPSSRQLSPKLRAFVDFIAGNLLAA